MDRERSIVLPCAWSGEGNQRVPAPVRHPPHASWDASPTHIPRESVCLTCRTLHEPIGVRPFSPTANSSDRWKISASSLDPRPAKCLPHPQPSRPAACEPTRAPVGKPADTVDRKAEQSALASPTNPPSPGNLFAPVGGNEAPVPLIHQASRPARSRGAGWWMDRYILPAPSILEARPRLTFDDGSHTCGKCAILGVWVVG
jgi:hypothetical protein